MPIRFSFVGLEGFLNAKLLVEILRRIGPAMDKARIRPAAESIRDYDLGIQAPASLSPTTHKALNQVYYTTFEKGHFVPVRSWDNWRK